MARRGGLGKGLGALIPPGATLDSDTDTGGGLEQLPTSAIQPNRFQPRDHFDEEALGALADSIREVGVLQPVLVRPVDGGYELIAGERRWRAARRVGLQIIPALVREADDATSLQHALVENLHRDGLNPLEEAAAYQQLIEDFGLTHEAVASQVGKSRTSVTNSLRLLQLPPSIQKLVHEGRLSMGQARALLATPDRAFQEELARRVVQDDLSVRAVEDAIREHDVQPSSSPAASTPEPKGRRSELRPPGLLELEELLGDHLETRVTITMGSAGGKVVVEFSTLEDLERLYRLMTQGAGGHHPEVVAFELLVRAGRLLDAAANPHDDGAGDAAPSGDETARPRDVVVRRGFAEHGRHARFPQRSMASPADVHLDLQHRFELGAHRRRDAKAGLGTELARGVVAAAAPGLIAGADAEEQVGVVAVRRRRQRRVVTS